MAGCITLRKAVIKTIMHINAGDSIGIADLAEMTDCHTTCFCSCEYKAYVKEERVN